MLLSVWFADSPLLRSPREKPIDVIHAPAHGYNRGRLHDDSCLCCLFENKISQAAPTETTSRPGTSSHTQSGAGLA